MNKDIELLRNCRGLRREIEHLNRQIERDRQALYGSSVQYDDLPKARGCPNGGDERYVQLCDKEDVRNQTLERYQSMLREAERVLLRVTDSLHRMIYRLSYLAGLPAWKVAREVHCSESTVKRIRYRAEKEESLK